jgi:hypothetical protein
MNIITICIFIFAFFGLAPLAHAEPEFFGKQNNGTAVVQCEYLLVKAPPGWVISELKLKTKENIRNQIAAGGVFYSYVLLRDGYQEGSAANIVFVPKQRAEYLISQQKLSVNVSKENCRMGNPANRVSSQIGESFLPFHVITKIKNAELSSCSIGKKCTKTASKRGMIIYILEH